MNHDLWHLYKSHERKAKVKNITFRGNFLTESAANEWLVNPNFQTPIKPPRKPLLFSGKVESPLRKPRAVFKSVLSIAQSSSLIGPNRNDALI